MLCDLVFYFLDDWDQDDEVLPQEVTESNGMNRRQKHFPQRNEPSFKSLPISNVFEHNLKVEFIEIAGCLHELLPWLDLQDVDLCL